MENQYPKSDVNFYGIFIRKVFIFYLFSALLASFKVMIWPEYQTDVKNYAGFDADLETTVEKLSKSPYGITLKP